MKKSLYSICLLFTVIAAQAQTPTITMTTTTPVGNNFLFKISTLADNTPIQVDWGNGTLTSYTIIGTYYWVSSILTGSTIKIYGQNITALMVSYKNLTVLDVSMNTMLTNLMCNGNKLTTLNVSTNTALTELYCQENNLTTLDISKNTILTNLNCSANQLNVLDVSQNTSLTTLNCNMNLLASLNVSKNIALTSLECHMNQIATLDVSKNLLLTKLSCFSNWIREFDVSKNTALKTLSCSWNHLTTLNVSNNTALEELDCSNHQITTLDVSANTALTKLGCVESLLTVLNVSKNTTLMVLSCSRNQLKTLDVSKNTALIELYCSSNQLKVLDVSTNTALKKYYCDNNQVSKLDISKNTSLTHLDCSSNLLKFSTLPVKQSSWTDYFYSQQKQVALQKRNYTLVETIDLSSQLTINNNTTTYTWKTKDGTTLVAGIDFNLTNGITTFLKTNTDSVYCQMTNATFPDLTLSTTNVKVTQFPTSIDEARLKSNIYPNPFKESLNIELNEDIAKVEVFTILGAKIFEMQGNNRLSMTIPAANLPKGFLIVKTYGRNGVMERKVLKE